MTANRYDQNSISLEAKSLVSKQIQNGFKLTELYSYIDINGAPYYWRIRLEKNDKKIIFPMHRDQNGKFFLKEPDFGEFKKPLYQLDQLHKNLGRSVFVVEGEKCVNTLMKLGILATTSGGSASADKTDWSILKNRRVVIWRDADEAGLSYAHAVTKILVELGCLVKWVDIDCLKLPDGGDCVDWIKGHSETNQESISKLALIDPVDEVNIKASDSVLSQYPRYELRDSGVYLCKGVNDAVWVCSWLTVKALTRDSEGINWGRVLEFKDADGVVHQWTMPMELVGGNGDELAKELLKLGLRIAPGAASKKLLVEYITNFETDSRARCVLKTGWNKDLFVLPEKVYGETDELVLMQFDTPTNLGYSTSGSHEEWISNISLYCKGNSRLLFAVSLAFAAPLVRLLCIEGGGFHIRGSSSTGKTTILQVAASVWGGADFMHNWRATDNGIEGIAATHNDTLLILDEIAQVDPRYAGEVAYMLANGQGKARASRSGNIKQRKAWRLLFLSSGEISLASHMQIAGKKVKAGQEVRMVDVPADAEAGLGVFQHLHNFDNGVVFSEFLKNASEKYYGTAADLFLQKLVECNRIELQQCMSQIKEKFLKIVPESAHGQVKRVAMRFAVIAMAGELATQFGVTGWGKGDAIRACIDCFNAYRNSSDKSDDSYEQQEILSQVRHFFLENAARFDTGDNENDYQNRHIPHKCAGYKMQDGYFVFPKTFNDEVCNGLGSPKDVRKICIEHGLLIPDQSGKGDSKPIHVPAQGKTIRLYHFSKDVIADK